MSLASHGGKPKFEDVAGTEAGTDINTEVPTVSDIVDDVLNEPKEKPKVQISIYLDEDVAKAFDKFAKKKGKGAKSKLINTFLKKALF